MKKITICQQFLDKSADMFSIFSKRDDVLLFCMAKDGLKTHSSELHDEIPTKKRYYKALKQLKDAGLIEKAQGSRDTYFHTKFGSIIYQKMFVELTEITNNKQKIKIFDTLKQANTFSTADIQKFFDSAIGITTQRSEDLLSFNSEIIWSHDKLILSMIEKVRNCKNEILLATRLYSEPVVNELILKSKVGVNVKILADAKLIEGYFKSQINYYENSNEDYKIGKNNEKERLKVIGNPWYPNNEGVQRKVMDIPFSLLVIDEMEVGIEIVNSNDAHNFFAAVFIRDKKLALDVKEFYMKLWKGASYEISFSHNSLN
jgi:DNA-binding transcriptional ArsR family regulator